MGIISWGAIVFNIFPEIKNRFLNETLSFFAFIALIYPCFFYSNLTIFPGYSALLPVIGSAMLIHLGKSNDTIIKSFLKINCKLSKLDETLLEFEKKNNLKKYIFKELKSIKNLKFGV